MVIFFAHILYSRRQTYNFRFHTTIHSFHDKAQSILFHNDCSSIDYIATCILQLHARLFQCISQSERKIPLACALCKTTVGSGFYRLSPGSAIACKPGQQIEKIIIYATNIALYNHFKFIPTTHIQTIPVHT
jgi:hypothetical protein